MKEKIKKRIISVSICDILSWLCWHLAGEIYWQIVGEVSEGFAKCLPIKAFVIFYKTSLAEPPLKNDLILPSLIPQAQKISQKSS